MKHLSDEDIARLIDGKIGKKEREDFLKHISDCDDCLTIYTETMKFIESEKQEPETATNLGFWEILSRIKHKVNAIFPGKRWLLVPAAATLLIALLLIILPVILKTPVQYKAPWLLKKSGDYAAANAVKDPRVNRAASVFERVSNAADKSGDTWTRFIITNNIIIDGYKLCAVALLDNCVAIAHLTLDYCYKGNDSEEGDRRLAFILGHELAHIHGENFPNREMAFAFQDYGYEKDPEKFFKDNPRFGDNKSQTEDFKKKEFEADKRGVFYAQMAGYDVRKLFTGSNDFFKRWSKLTRIDYEKDQVMHPAPGKRARLIREELAKLADDAQLFRVGILLFVSGAYTDALAAFQAFAEIYPAREVYNNIGACYLHQAQAKIFSDFSEDYFRFRHAVVIDYSTTADSGQMRGGENYLTDPDISRYLKMAEAYFDRAAQRDTLDSACRLNLAAAYIWRQEYAKAIDVCDNILTRNSLDAGALNNKAIALYYQAKQKNRAEAAKLLEKATALKPDHYESLYNLAIIAEESGQDGQAKNLWDKYLSLEHVPRDQYYRFVYEKLKGKVYPKPGITANFPKIPQNINIGDNVSDIREKMGKEPSKIYEAEIAGAEALKLKLQVLTVAGLRIVALDDMVTIVEQEFSKPEDIEVIQKDSGSPNNLIHHINGNIYIYSNENRGFAIKEIAGKVRAYIWF